LQVVSYFLGLKVAMAAIAPLPAVVGCGITGQYRRRALDLVEFGLAIEDQRHSGQEG
jgi:hypothetical protein